MRTLKWLLLNTAITACFILGPNMDIEWASNISIFAAWFHLTWVIFAVAIRSDDMIERYEMSDKMVNQNKVPIAIRKAWDIVNIIALIVPGWMWSAAAYATGYLFYSVSINYMQKYLKEVGNG